MKIRKAVIPVAGKGTRFLPVTKEIPKEMIPILGKPMIQYVVEEAIQSGIEQIIFVTASNKHTIENYFDHNVGLETFLKEKNKEKDFAEIHSLAKMVEIASVRQKEQLGLGHAILCAKEVVGNEPFCVLLGDDLIISKTPVTKQLMDVSEKFSGKSVIGVMKVNDQDVSSYGIVEGQTISGHPNIVRMTNMIEKPKVTETQSRLATPGRYLFDPEIFSYLKKIKRGNAGEYQLTDAIKMMCLDRDFLAYSFVGDRFDTGTIAAHLRATVEFALRDPLYCDLMKELIKEKYHANC